MPRRGFVPKREVLPDPVHGTTVVTKLINQIMLDGKRGVAQNVCYEAFWDSVMVMAAVRVVLPWST